MENFINKYTAKKATVFLLFILSCVMALSAALSFSGVKKTKAASFTQYYIGEKGDGSVVSDLYNEKLKVFNKKLLDELFAKTTGIEKATADDVKQYITDNGEDEFGSKVIKNTVLQTNADASFGIVIKIGGINWHVTSLTLDRSGNPVATVKSMSTKSVANNRFSWVNGDLNISTTTSRTYTDDEGATPQNLYGISDLRRQMHLTTESNYFYKIVGEFGQRFIVKPTNIEYQHKQAAVEKGSLANFNSEALDNVGGTFANQVNYYGKTNYAAWGNDYIWLPSMTEVGWVLSNYLNFTTRKTTGIWGISDSVGYYRNSAAIYRVGYSARSGICGSCLGESVNASSYYPCFHLNLTEAEKNAKLMLDDPTDVTAEYSGEELDIESVGEEGKTWYDAEKLNLTYYDLEGNEVTGYTELGTYKVKAEIKQEFIEADIVFNGTADTSDAEHLESDTVRWFNFTVGKKKLGADLTTDLRGMPQGAFKSLTGGGTGIYSGDTAENGRAPVMGLKYKGRGSTSYAESTTPPTQQGTYTATAYIVNADDVPYELSGTLTIDFEIIKTLPQYSATDINIVYGTEYAVDEGTTSDGALTITYYVADGTTVIAEKPTDVGTYKAKVSTEETADYSAYEKVITIVITIAKPTVNPVVPEKVYYHEGDAMPSITLAEGDTAGVIKWANGSVVELGPHTYTWEYTPSDTHNYESASGEIQLNFLPVALGEVKVEEFTQSGVIYAGGDLNALKSMLKVAAYNNDGTKNKDLTAAEYTLSGELTVGDAEITVHYSGFETTFTVTVTADSLKEITAVFAQGNNEVYPTTDLDALKQWLTVTAVYDSGREESVTEYELTGTLAAGSSEVTVNYGGKTATFNVTVTAVAVKEITAVFTQGANEVYTSTPLDDLKQWLVVTAVYNNGTSETVTDYTLTGTLVAGGSSVILVTYGGKTATFTNVTVTAVVITELTVTYSQSGAVYTGASLEILKKDITVKAVYNDGSENNNVTEYTLTGDLSVSGTKTVTLSYGGIEKQITVEVSDITLTTIEVSFTQSGTIYAGSDLNALKTMLTVKATYSNGDTDADFKGYTLEGDLTAAGSITVNVKAGDLSEAFTVTVTADALKEITAVFTQGNNEVYPTTDLDALKQWLTVTAVYDSGKEENVTEYELTGTLAAGSSEITVNYGGKTATFNVTVTAVAVKEITAVFTQGANKVYTSTPLDDLKQWLVVTAVYNSGASEEVTDYTLAGALANGTAVIMVSYGGKTASFTVAVTEVKAVSIEVTYTPQEVFAGSSLDSLKKDITVKAVYNDGSENNNVTDYTLEGDLSTEGSKTVIVKYGGLQEEITVEVSGIAFTDITVQFKQNGKVYAGGDINDITRWLTVKAVYSNGREEVVTDYTLSGAFDRVGDVDITVSYNGKEKTVTVAVSAATVVTKPTVKNPSLVFDGEEHGYADFISGFESNIMEFAETPAVMKNVGGYTVKIKIKDTVNVAWDENGDKSAIELTFEITTLKFAKPENGGKLQYTGAEQSFMPDGLNAAFVTITGNAGTGIDVYTATAALNDKYNTAWLDGSTDDVTFTWEITKKTISRPTVTSPETIVYTGEEIDVTGMLGGYDADMMSVSGEVTGTDAKTYTVTITLKDAVHYEWAEEAGVFRVYRANGAEIEITWEIQKAKLMPEWSSASGTPTFKVPEKYEGLAELEYIFTDENGKAVAKEDLVSGKKYKVTAKLKDSCKNNFAFVSASGEVLATPEESAPYEFMPAGTAPVTPPSGNPAVGGGMKAWQFWVLFGAIMLNALILLCKKTGVQVNVGNDGKELEPRKEAVIPKGTRLVKDNQFVNLEEAETNSSLYAFEAREGESVRTVSDGAVVFESEKLTFAQEYELLSQEGKDYLDGLKKYACENSAAQEKEGKFGISVGSGSKQVIKLGIKNGTVMAMFRLEDPRLMQLRRSAEGAEIKVKETLIPITDVTAYETAKQMIDLRISQIAEDVAAKRQARKERLKAFRDAESEAAAAEDKN